MIVLLRCKDEMHRELFLFPRVVKRITERSDGTIKQNVSF
jgi:hypothetical protein